MYELVGWTAGPLRLPGLCPSEASERAERIAEQFWDGLDGWSPWSSKELPAPFLAQVAQAVAGSVHQPPPRVGTGDDADGLSTTAAAPAPGFPAPVRGKARGGAVRLRPRGR
ncbi:hypothetical protein ACFW6V_04720 [Streptomyces sp. NPDC058734]|uniref:hypothetical protein n=1 Tax=Streptomyces sp. NPDC058734 TaxID=3346615 RepID=UPI0036AAB7B6